MNWGGGGGGRGGGALLIVAFNKTVTEMNIYGRKLQTVMPSHTPCRAL